MPWSWQFPCFPFRGSRAWHGEELWSLKQLRRSGSHLLLAAPCQGLWLTCLWGGMKSWKPKVSQGSCPVTVLANEALSLKYSSSLVSGKMVRPFCYVWISLSLSLSYYPSQCVWSLYVLNRFMCLIITSFKDLQCPAAVSVTLPPQEVKKVKILHQGKGKN